MQMGRGFGARPGIVAGVACALILVGSSTPSAAQSARVGNFPRSFEGISNPGASPPDTTSAIGTTRYVETVNVHMAIYDRAGTLLSSGRLRDLSGDPGFGITDPQVIWDPGTERFYYSFLDDSGVGNSSANNKLWIGFSKTSSPSTFSDWCSYAAFDYGQELPDYPHLGDTADFLLVGVNVFGGDSNFVGTDVDWLTKPPAGDVTGACPSLPPSGRFTDLRTGTNEAAYTPIPVNQIDPDGTGYVLAIDQPRTFNGTCVPGNSITVFAVIRSGSIATISSGHDISVGGYCFPPDVPQAGTPYVLDSADGRLTQAVSAKDPAHGDSVGIWTQHTIASSDAARSVVRWYEFDPVAVGPAAVLQTGTIDDPSLFVFNGAISPDRVVNGATTAFGDSMILGFNTSSATTLPAIQMVSKAAGAGVSAFTLVQSSSGAEIDPTCHPPEGERCRWGDYAGATPDPGADPSGPHGLVWLANQWSAAGSDDGVDWRTWNWAAPIADVIEFTGASFSVNENGGSATISVERFGATDGDSVSFTTSNGTATSSDYEPQSGTITWAASDPPLKTFIVPIVNDTTREAPETINLLLSQPTNGAALGAPATATLTITASDQQPDEFVRVTGGSFIGNNIYNTTGAGQTVAGKAARGATAIYYAVIQNEGPGPNRFRGIGSAGTSAFTVRYLYGTRDITAQLIAASYTTGLMPVGDTRVIKVLVTPTSRAVRGSSKTVGVTSVWGIDVVTRDSVLMKTTVS